MNLKGFRMPAEWEKHEGTWLTFPHDEAHWPGKFKKIPAIWAHMVKELEEGEDVHIAIHDESTQKIVEKEFKKAGVTGKRVHFHRIPNNFSWARDHGPIFVKNETGKRQIIHWGYNAWGNKYPHDLDEQIPTHVSKILKVPEVKAPMILEGGSIDVNGKGTLITTASCLLNPNRNPQLTQDQIENNLKDYLGVSHVIWLTGEVVGDDTSGHVDDMTRFVNPHTVVTVVEEDPEDENYSALNHNYQILQKSKDQDGHPLNVIKLPMPEPVLYKGERLPASYANFYIGNNVILLPVYNCPQDAIAIQTLQGLFPDRKIAAIDGTDLIWGLGSFHCVTQQIPA